MEFFNIGDVDILQNLFLQTIQQRKEIKLASIELFHFNQMVILRKELKQC